MKSVKFQMASVVFSLLALSGVAQAQALPAGVSSVECKYPATGEQFVITPLASEDHVLVTPAQLITVWSETAGPRKVLSAQAPVVYQVKAIQGGISLRNDQLRFQADRKLDLKSEDGVTGTLEKLQITEGLPGFARGGAFIRAYSCVFHR